MNVPFVCPHCQKRTLISEEFIGQTGPCLHCGKVVEVSRENLDGSLSPSQSDEWSVDEAFRGDDRRRWLAFSKLIGVAVLLGVLGVIGVGGFLWVLLPLLGLDAETARRQRVAEKLKTLASAMQAYHDDYGRLPPPVVYDSNGKPIQSWRALLIPYLDRKGSTAEKSSAQGKAGYMLGQMTMEGYRLDEPWDSNHNSQYHSVNFPAFQLPGEGLTTSLNHTGFMVIVGVDTLFDDNKLGTPLQSATDGLSSTLLIVQVEESGVHWLEPVDLDASKMSYVINGKFPGTGLSDEANIGAWALTADGEPKFLPNSTSSSQLRSMVTRSAGD